MTIRKKLTLAFLFLFSLPAFCQDTVIEDSTSDQNIQFRTVAEVGFLGVIDHKVQFGRFGDYFDYQKDGGQNVLFPITRFSMELDYKKKHAFILLYQPLRLETKVKLDNDLVINDVLFPASSTVNLLYSFPFYRFSYLKTITSEDCKLSVAIGPTLQVRNATISFESADGSLYQANRDVGIVPAFKIRAKLRHHKKSYLELEADGIYAPISYLNGSDNEVVGAILDASIRQGFQITEPLDVFVNLRYLGGGSVGASDDTNDPGDGYSKNWLHFMTFSAGFGYQW
jgi:hypothetical protein